MQLVFIKLDFPFPALLISKEDAKAIEKILEEDEKKILTIFDNMKSLLSEYKVFVHLSILFIVYLHVYLKIVFRKIETNYISIGETAREIINM